MDSEEPPKNNKADGKEVLASEIKGYFNATLLSHQPFIIACAFSDVVSTALGNSNISLFYIDKYEELALPIEHFMAPAEKLLVHSFATYILPILSTNVHEKLRQNRVLIAKGRIPESEPIESEQEGVINYLLKVMVSIRHTENIGDNMREYKPRYFSLLASKIRSVNGDYSFFAKRFQCIKNLLRVNPDFFTGIERDAENSIEMSRDSVLSFTVFRFKIPETYINMLFRVVDEEYGKVSEEMLKAMCLFFGVGLELCFDSERTAERFCQTSNITVSPNAFRWVISGATVYRVLGTPLNLTSEIGRYFGENVASFKNFKTCHLSRDFVSRKIEIKSNLKTTTHLKKDLVIEEEGRDKEKKSSESNKHWYEAGQENMYDLPIKKKWIMIDNYFQTSELQFLNSLSGNFTIRVYPFFCKGAEAEKFEEKLSDGTFPQISKANLTKMMDDFEKMVKKMNPLVCFNSLQLTRNHNKVLAAWANSAAQLRERSMMDPDLVFLAHYREEAQRRFNIKKNQKVKAAKKLQQEHNKNLFPSYVDDGRQFTFIDYANAKYKRSYSWKPDESGRDLYQKLKEIGNQIKLFTKTI